MWQWIRLAFAVLALPLGAAACAVVIDPESLGVHCSIDPANPSDDPCLALGKQKCIDNICRVCNPDVMELCNGVDDDCDSRIDEGHDSDNDGFTWCGGGRLELRDCVVTDAKIHPAPLLEDGTFGRAPEEICDGKDNDCDSRVDENRVCGEMKKCPEIECPENQICDVPNGVCIAPRPVGSGCMNDSDCKDGFCVSPGAFGLPSGLMDSRCATACCSDTDCKEGNVCVISNSGARACLPRNIVGGGTKKALEACRTDRECMSGLCSRERCQTRCFHNSGCPGAGCILSFGDATEPRIFWCGALDQRMPSGDPCSLATSCQTNLCTAESICAAACSRDSDCPADQYCKSSEVRAGIIGPMSPIAICAHRSSVPPDAGNLPHLCCTNDDCAGGLCAPESPRMAQWHMSCRLNLR